MGTSASTPTTVEEVHEATPEVVDALQGLDDYLTRSAGPPSPAEVAEMIASPATRLLVARGDDGTIDGALTLVSYTLPSGPRAWIEDVVVFEPGRGIGRQLVAEGLRLAKEGGATSVELLVDPSQKAARHVFQHMGFGPYQKDTYRISL